MTFSRTDTGGDRVHLVPSGSMGGPGASADRAMGGSVGMAEPEPVPGSIVDRWERLVAAREALAGIDHVLHSATPPPAPASRAGLGLDGGGQERGAGGSAGGLRCLTGSPGEVSVASPPGLAVLLELVDDVAALAAAARVLVTAEAVRAEVPVAESLDAHGWVRAHAASLRQGGSRQVALLARRAAAASRGSGLGVADEPVSCDGSGAPVDGTVSDDPTEGTGGGDDAASMPAAVGHRPPTVAERLALVDPQAPLSRVWSRLRTGEVGAPLAGTVLREIARLERRLVPEAVATVTDAMTDLGVAWGPGEAARLGPALLAAHGLEGELDREQERLAPAAFLSAPGVRSGGLTEYRMALTPAQAAILEAALSPLAKPRPNDRTRERDLRSNGQRRAEALEEVCRAAAGLHADGTGCHGSGPAPRPGHAYGPAAARADRRSVEPEDGRAADATRAASTGAVPTASPGSGATASHPSGPTGSGWDGDAEDDSDWGDTSPGAVGDGWRVRARASASEGAAGSSMALVVTMDLADLIAGCGCGTVMNTTAAGTLLSPSTVRRLACDADLIPAVLGSDGALLDLGRVSRLASREQRRALAIRDGGCTYPGCDTPAAWCRAHHVRWWFHGGASDISNLALLCQAHHTIVHGHNLGAEVRPRPDDVGRHVIWDLTPGSYDTGTGGAASDTADHASDTTDHPWATPPRDSDRGVAGHVHVPGTGHATWSRARRRDTPGERVHSDRAETRSGPVPDRDEDVDPGQVFLDGLDLLDTHGLLDDLADDPPRQAPPHGPRAPRHRLAPSDPDAPGEPGVSDASAAC